MNYVKPQTNCIIRLSPGKNEYKIWHYIDFNGVSSYQYQCTSLCELI